MFSTILNLKGKKRNDVKIALFFYATGSHQCAFATYFLMFLETSVLKCPAVTHVILTEEVVLERCLYELITDSRSK